MKKGLLILVLLNTIMYLNVQSQDADSIYYKKKPKFCMAKITRMNGDQEKYALFGFSNDSILAFRLLEKENKKEIQLNDIRQISCKDIKRVFIKIDKSIVLPDSIFNDSDLKNDSLNSAIKTAHRNNQLKKYAMNYAVDQLLLPDYFEYPGLGLLALGIGLFIGPKGKIYYIQGEEKKFNRMVRSLTINKNEQESYQNE